MKYLLIILILSSCAYNRDAATKQHGRAVTIYPEIGAAFCADKYPVRSTTDSTQYLRSREIIDSLAQVLRDDSLISVIERESLEADIDRIRSEIVHPENCDSLYDGLYRLVAAERKRADRLEKLNRQVVTVTTPPIIITKENTAALKACEIIRDKAVLLAEDYKKEAASWRSKARTRFWIIAALGATTLLGFFLAFKRKATPAWDLNQGPKPK